jgi:hypothetical protein
MRNFSLIPNTIAYFARTSESTDLAKTNDHKSVYHLRMAEPQVNPPPIASRRMRSPRLMRPS